MIITNIIIPEEMLGDDQPDGRSIALGRAADRKWSWDSGSPRSSVTSTAASHHRTSRHRTSHHQNFRSG